MFEGIRMADLRAVGLTSPETTLQRFIEPLGTLPRGFDTSWRGPVVFIGQGEAWALAQLANVKPFGKSQWLWIFESFEYLPERVGYPCRGYQGTVSFPREDGRIEPIYASAGLCRDLEEMMARHAAPIVAEPEAQPEPIEPEPVQVLEPMPEPIERGPALQLSLF